MRFTHLLALRYAFGLRKKVAVTLISRFAAFIISVAVFAFFVVLSVFGGLSEFGLQFTHAFDPDIRISSAMNRQFVVDGDVFVAVQNHPDVTLTSATLSQEMMLRFEDRTAFANIIGVDSLFYAVVEGKTMVGEWVQPGAYELVLGIGVLSQLGNAAYDHPEGITLLVPKRRSASVLNQQAFSAQSAFVRGVFQIGASIDENTAYAPIDMVQQISRTTKNQAGALYVKLADNADEISVLFVAEVLAVKISLLSCLDIISDVFSSNCIGMPCKQISFSSIAEVISFSISPGYCSGLDQPLPINFLSVLSELHSGAG